jgi:2-polyprenyl-3-methyl-5-hydroxy-6-metoxy-1,4-benzoquinol methylase
MKKRIFSISPDPSDAANFGSHRVPEHALPMDGALCALGGRRLLDVGAGSGKLVRYLRSRGVDAHGIEPSRALFARFLAGDAAFTCATLGEISGWSAARFDIVTALRRHRARARS